MIASARRSASWIAAVLFAALSSSCGENAPAPEEPQRQLPEIKPTHRHMELLAKPGREISFEANEIHFRHGLGNRVLLKFYEGDFAELERLATIYRGGMLTASGIEKLGPFYWSFIEDMIVDNQGVDMRAPGLIAAWKVQFPQSPTPYIATAFMYEEVARRMERGGDPPVGLARKQRFRDEALLSLTQNWNLVRIDPYAHGMKMRLIGNGAVSKETWEEAFEQARREHPGRFVIYFEAANSAPKANDSLLDAAASSERIAGMLAEAMGEDGDIGYARTWWAASGRYYGKLLFERRMVNWARIRNGFHGIIETYPEPWNVNNFARFSCMVGDAPKLRYLAPAVRQYPDDTVWSHEIREYCLLSADAQIEEIPTEPQSAEGVASPARRLF